LLHERNAKARQVEILLSKKTAAIEAILKDGRWQCGVCVHLPPESLVEICGEGFSKQTIRVRSGTAQYFLLRTSIAPEALRTDCSKKS
jgi:hypothetical protein